jgi:hypothetical protein
MRRIGVILAGAALALALVSPVVAGATDKSSSGTTITAQGVRGGHGNHGSFHGGHGFSRHDHGRFFFHRGAGCWGCGYPFWFYGYPYYYGYPYGYYPGGFGCNFDYPCGPPYPESSCARYRASSRSAQPAPDNTQCRPAGSNGQAPPPQQAQPAPSQGQPPADQGMAPGPDQGQQPGAPGPAGGGQY